MYAQLSRVDLSGARLSHARIQGSNLSGANLTEADLWSVSMNASVFPGSDLRGTNLERSGVYRTQALARFPDIKHSHSTRWDRPAPPAARVQVPVSRALARPASRDRPSAVSASSAGLRGRLKSWLI